MVSLGVSQLNGCAVIDSCRNSLIKHTDFLLALLSVLVRSKYINKSPGFALHCHVKGAEID